MNRGNPKKDKSARRKRPDRSKNPLKIINPWQKRIKPKFEKTEVTEEMAIKRTEYFRKVFLGRTWTEKLVDWFKGLLWKILTKINKWKYQRNLK